MKSKIKNTGRLVIILVVLTLLLSSCSYILQGTYANLELGYGTKYSFSGNTFSKIDIGLLSKTVETGKFSLGKDTISFVYDDNPDLNRTVSFEKGNDFIKIDGVVFIKE